jgi:hypothetical protein
MLMLSLFVIHSHHSLLFWRADNLFFFVQVVGLDLVDDESKPERRPTKHMPTPEQWTNVFNPAYAYYVYYCYANLYTLNKVNIFVHGPLPVFSYL